MNDKIKSSRTNKKTKKESKKEIVGWVLFTLVYAVFLMWISGMAQAYFPALVSPGGGQYFDVPIGVIVIGTSLYFVLATYIFKKNMRGGDKL
jgi:polyferredoxin